MCNRAVGRGKIRKISCLTQILISRLWLRVKIQNALNSTLLHSIVVEPPPPVQFVVVVECFFHSGTYFHWPQNIVLLTEQSGMVEMEMMMRWRCGASSVTAGGGGDGYWGRLCEANPFTLFSIFKLCNDGYRPMKMMDVDFCEKRRCWKRVNDFSLGKSFCSLHADGTGTTVERAFNENN